MTLSELITEQVNLFVEEVKAQIANGIQFSDAAPLFHALQTRLMFVAQQATNIGPEKKEAVLAGMESFFDAVVVPFDIPWVPEWAEQIIESRARDSIRPVFGPAIDGTVSGLKYVGQLLSGLNPFR